MLNTEYSSYLPQFLQWMLIKQVLREALDSVRVEIIEAGVEIDGDNRDFLGDQNRFGFAEEFSAAFQISLHVGAVDEVVVARIFPAGAVVATDARVHVQECIGVVVVADR